MPPAILATKLFIPPLRPKAVLRPQMHLVMTTREDPQLPLAGGQKIQEAL